MIVPLGYLKAHWSFFRIHIWLTPLLAYSVPQYFWRPSLTAVRIRVRFWERGLVEHLAEPALYIYLYGFLLSLWIQYNLGKLISSSGKELPNVSITERWFRWISSLGIAVRLYVGFPVMILIPISFIKQFIWYVLQTNTMLLDALSARTTTNFSSISANSDWDTSVHRGHYRFNPFRQGINLHVLFLGPASWILFNVVKHRKDKFELKQSLAELLVCKVGVTFILNLFKIEIIIEKAHKIIRFQRGNTHLWRYNVYTTQCRGIHDFG